MNHRELLNHPDYKGASLVHYDSKSQSHLLVEEILFKSFNKVNKSMPPIVHRSLPRIMNLLTSKRSTIKKIRNHIINI